jgi:hypothetical protein
MRCASRTSVGQGQVSLDHFERAMTEQALRVNTKNATAGIRWRTQEAVR